MKYNFDELVTIDYETFYSSTYSLRAKVYNTSSYITDPQFQIHCCAIKMGKKKSKCYWGQDAIDALKAIDWSKHDLLAHNNFFDGFISAYHLGIRPRRRFCTLQMTRGLHSDMSKASLQAICEFYGIPGKTEGLNDVKGLRTEQITGDKKKNLMSYCNNDNEKCFEVFKKQIEVFPEREIKLIDITLSMFCDPVLELDVPRAEASLNYEMNERLKFIAISGADEKTLKSTDKFVAALEALGVDAPKKVSKYNGEISYALAETDAEFIMLQEHEDPRVVRLVQGRLAAKSTMMETRAWRLIQMMQSCGSLPVLLNYYGAKTGRWSGGNKCLAGDTTIIVQREGEVLYISLSALIDSDKVWDGVEFVSHSGLIDQGTKGVMTYDGITGTPDHEVCTAQGQTRLDHAEEAGYSLEIGNFPAGLVASS
jgi:hypothetical protein